MKKTLVTLILYIVISIFLFSSTWADEHWLSLNLHFTKDGIAVANADLILPAPPEIVYAVLTDYHHWPNLFLEQLQVNEIKTEDTRVVIDMVIPAKFFPIDLELVTETREIHPLRLETTLLRGDFDRYDWVWECSQTKDRAQTHATFILNVQPTIWIPNWLMRWILEHELEVHFHKIRDEAIKREKALAIEPFSTIQ